MSHSSRSTVVELRAHNVGQVVVFFSLSIVCAVLIFTCVAAPVMDAFFGTFLRSAVLRDGTTVTYSIGETRPEEVVTTNAFGTWALADPRALELQKKEHTLTGVIPRPVRADYVFKPLLALAPLVVVFGVVLGGVLTILLPAGMGFLRQKVEREILYLLDRLAVSVYGEHSNDEIRKLVKSISSADVRALHDLADSLKISFSEIELLAGALKWQQSEGFTKLFHSHAAIKFYMREHFTIQYSNTVLGLVYMGAAILIIVIGIRGLKFLPASDPSVVLGALGLEFMLLVTYAVMLMYGKPEDEPALTTTGSSAAGITAVDSSTEQLIRAFLGVRRNNKRNG